MCELQKLAARVNNSRLRQKVTAREEQQDAEEDLEYFVYCNLDS